MFRIEHNVKTGEITEISLTTEEIAELKTAQQKTEVKSKNEAQAQAKRSVALAKLEQLGLTTDDLTALGL